MEEGEPGRHGRNPPHDFFRHGPPNPVTGTRGARLPRASMYGGGSGGRGGQPRRHRRCRCGLRRPLPIRGSSQCPSAAVPPPPHWTPEGQPTGKDRPQRPAAPAGKMAGANKTEMGWFLVSSCSGRRPAGPRPLVGVSGRAGRTQQPERGGRNNGCAFVGEEDGRGPRQPSPPPTRGTRRGCRRGADRLASRWAGGMGSVATASVLSRQRLARRRVGWGGGGWDAWFN